MAINPMTLPSGTHIAYFFICKRKLWLFRHHISMEHESEAVKVGKLIDDTTFNRERKSRMVDGVVNMDFIRGNKIVHEIKKSDAQEDAHMWQVRYYLYILKKKGLGVEKGVIHYPKQKKTLEVVLSLEDEVQIETQILPQIQEILSLKTVPEKINKPVCKKCSYYSFCYV